MEVKYQLNTITYDSFGRPSGVLLLDKKENVSAHDLVNMVRKKLDFKKVGHAGALDTFSTGLMLILVGKATKLSDQFMGLEKEYNATLIVGVATETQDTEGKPIAIEDSSYITPEEITEAINAFIGGYEQYVSPFSSVKVAGKKLRKVLRNKSFKYEIVETHKSKFIELYEANTGVLKERLEIPKRFIDIKKITIKTCEPIDGSQLPYSEKITGTFWKVNFDVRCSKGTYIRQLAEDIGIRLESPASLIALRRTRIGEYDESMVDHSVLS